VAGLAAGEGVDGVGDLGGGVLAEHGEDGDDVGGQPVGQAGLAEPVEGGGVGDGDELDRAAGRLRQLGGDVWKVTDSGPVSS
jgi:hypothetical protein